MWQLLSLHLNYNDFNQFYVLIHFCVCLCCMEHFVQKPSETFGNIRKHPGNTLKLTRKHSNCLDLITADTVFVSCVSRGWSGCLSAIPSVFSTLTKGMALNHPDQPRETHETNTVSAVIKSRQLWCFRVSFRVFPGCFRVFPNVSEGSRTKCLIQHKQTQKWIYVKRINIVVIQM